MYIQPQLTCPGAQILGHLTENARDYLTEVGRTHQEIILSR